MTDRTWFRPDLCPLWAESIAVDMASPEPLDLTDILQELNVFIVKKGPPMKPQPPDHHHLAREVIEAADTLSDAIEEAVSAGLQVSGTFYDNDGEGLHVHDLTGEINIAVTKNEILAETD